MTAYLVTGSRALSWRWRAEDWACVPEDGAVR